MFPIVKPVRLITSSSSNRAKLLDKDQNNDSSIFLESEPLTDHKEVKRGWNLMLRVRFKRAEIYGDNLGRHLLEVA